MNLAHKTLVAFFYALGGIKALFHAPEQLVRWTHLWWTIDYGAPEPWNKVILDLKRACLCWGIAASFWFLSALLFMIQTIY